MAFYAKLLFLSMCLLFSQVDAHAQSFVWANHFGGKGTSSPTRLSPGANIAKGIAIDSSNNVYTVGWFNDSVDFNPGAAQHFMVGNAEDGYVVKCNQHGEFVWAFALSSALNDMVTDIAFDAENNFYILGQCQGKTDFDPSAAVFELQSDHGGANFLFLAKYTSDGQLLWANSISGDYFAVHGYALAIDKNDDVLITGSLYDQVDFDPSPATQWVGGNKQGAFFAKYNGDGNLIWAKSINGLGIYGGGSDIAVSPAGNIFITGYFGNAVDFDPSNSDSTIIASTTADRFFAKYDAQGNFIWARNINTNNDGGLTHGRACQIVVTENETVTISGDFSGDVDFRPGSATFILSSPNTTSTYLAQYDSDGQLMWAKAIYGGYCIPAEMALDCENNILLTGCFIRADFDIGFDFDFMQSEAPSAFNNFLAKYTLQGDYLWAKQMGNNGYGGGIIIPTLAVKNEAQYVGGGFKQTADFDPDSTASNIKQATGIGHNSFVAKYKRTNQFLAEDTAMCIGQQLILEVNVPGATFLWQDGSTQPSYVAKEPGTYTVEITTATCTFIESIIVHQSYCPEQLQMPNVFSPNHDGINDFFKPILIEGIENWNLSIYNRWGSAVYNADNNPQGWDGTCNANPCAEGVYFWVIEYRDNQNKTQLLKGNVTLFR